MTKSELSYGLTNGLTVMTWTDTGTRIDPSCMTHWTGNDVMLDWRAATLDWRCDTLDWPAPTINGCGMETATDGLLD